MDEKGPELLAEVLARLFTARGWGQRQARGRLEAIWRQIVGDAVAQRSQLGALRHGVLEVFVSDPVLLQELANFRKRPLLDQLRTRLAPTKLVDLRFRLSSGKDK
jgi:predicted nucleic acid-binding Zn ribbon protein